MTLTQLRYFQILAHTLHYGKASEELCVAQPSLSRAISMLEEELGIHLFEKKGRNIVLSAAGSLFLPYVNQALAQIDSGIKVVSDYKSFRATVRIGSITPAINTYVTQQIISYEQQMGALKDYQIKAGISEELSDALIAGECDLIFASKIEEKPQITYVKVEDRDYAVVIPKTNPLSEKEVIYPEDLVGRDMLFTEAKYHSRNIKKMFEYYKIKPHIRGRANEDLSLLGMVEAGLGCFVTTDYPQLYRPGLVVRPLKQDKFKRSIYMGYINKKHTNPQAQEFIDFICANKIE